MEKVDQAKLLAHVPPHVRDKMLKRVEVLTRYVQDKTKQHAEQCAAELGLSIVHFKKLAQVWEMRGRADQLPGAEWPKMKSVATTHEQMAILREAVKEAPSTTVSSIMRRAVQIAKDRGISMPSHNTVRARIAELRADAVPARSFGADCDIVIVHAALNIPVEINGVATMPIATLAVHPSTRAVIGVGLSDTCVMARAAAEALAMALQRLPMSSTLVASDGPVRIGIDTLPGHEWESLLDGLNDVGALVEGEERKLPRRDAAATYLGRKVGGIEIRPRLATKPTAERAPYIASGQKALTLEEAKNFVIGRIVADVRPSARGAAADRVIKRLSQWLAEVG